MKYIHSIDFKPGTKEENLPGYRQDFPHITVRAQFGDASEHLAPWHWHQAIELFYVENGVLEYSVPSGTYRFPAGSGGFVNATVPHAITKPSDSTGYRFIVHIFDPALISGFPGSRIENRYVLPLIRDSRTGIMPLYPDDPLQAELLDLLVRSFRIRPDAPGYELEIRSILSRIWLGLWELACPPGAGLNPDAAGALSAMTDCIRLHYREKLTPGQIAEAAGLSEHAAQSLFQEHLHCSLRDHIRSRRVRAACALLRRTDLPMAQIAAECGFGSASGFSLSFREVMGCTPQEYRRQHASGP